VACAEWSPSSRGHVFSLIIGLIGGLTLTLTLIGGHVFSLIIGLIGGLRCAVKNEAIPALQSCGQLLERLFMVRSVELVPILLGPNGEGLLRKELMLELRAGDIGSREDRSSCLMSPLEISTLTLILIGGCV